MQKVYIALFVYIKHI